MPGLQIFNTHTHTHRFTDRAKSEAKHGGQWGA